MTDVQAKSAHCTYPLPIAGIPNSQKTLPRTAPDTKWNSKFKASLQSVSTKRMAPHNWSLEVLLLSTCGVRALYLHQLNPWGASEVAGLALVLQVNPLVPSVPSVPSVLFNPLLPLFRSFPLFPLFPLFCSILCYLFFPRSVQSSVPCVLFNPLFPLFPLFCLILCFLCSLCSVQSSVSSVLPVLFNPLFPGSFKVLYLSCCVVHSFPHCNSGGKSKVQSTSTLGDTFGADFGSAWG